MARSSIVRTDDADIVAPSVPARYVVEQAEEGRGLEPNNERTADFTNTRTSGKTVRKLHDEADFEPPPVPTRNFFEEDSGDDEEEVAGQTKSTTVCNDTGTTSLESDAKRENQNVPSLKEEKAAPSASRPSQSLVSKLKKSLQVTNGAAKTAEQGSEVGTEETVQLSNDETNAPHPSGSILTKLKKSVQLRSDEPSPPKKDAGASKRSKLKERMDEMDARSAASGSGRNLQPSLYTFNDFLPTTTPLSSHFRSPVSERLFDAVSTASKQFSASIHHNVLVLGHMHGELGKGVNLHEALQLTRKQCGLAPGVLIRQSCQIWPGMDSIAGICDNADSYGGELAEDGIDRILEATLLVFEVTAQVVEVAGSVIGGFGDVGKAAVTLLRRRRLMKGIKSQLARVNEKEGIQILCFDGQCFSVQGARLKDLEGIEKQESPRLDTYRLTDSSAIEHTAARNGCWMDMRPRALHEASVYNKRKFQIGLMQLRKGKVYELGWRTLKSPFLAIKQMDVTRLAGRFETKAEAGDKFWVELRELEKKRNKH